MKKNAIYGVSMQVWKVFFLQQFVLLLLFLGLAIRITLGSWVNELDLCSPYSISNSSTILNRNRITELDLRKFHRVRFQIGLVSPSSICHNSHQVR